jgi:hypothetical protein
MTSELIVIRFGFSPMTARNAKALQVLSLNKLTHSS